MWSYDDNMVGHMGTIIIEINIEKYDTFKKNTRFYFQFVFIFVFLSKRGHLLNIDRDPHEERKQSWIFFFFANLQENAYKTHSAIHIYIPFLYSWCIQQARFFVEWHLHTYQVQHLKPSALSLDKAFLSLPTIWHSLPISVELERVSVKEKGAGIDFTLSSRLPYSTAVCAGIQTRAWVSSFLSLNEESGQCQGMILATDVY